MLYKTGQVAALADLGLVKLAIKVPVAHGTSGPWKKLKVVGSPILKSDPNPRGIYVATDNRAKQKALKGFAQRATEARGGSPHVLKGKIDTKDGWEPRSLTSWGRKNIGTVDDAVDLVDDIERASAQERGPLWEKLQRGIGSWALFGDDASWTPAKAKKL